MRGPPRVVMVAPGIFAGPDGDEAVAPLRVGARAAGAREVRVDGRVVLVGAMRIAAGGIRLPDLDQGIRHRPAVLVEHATGHHDALADRLAFVLSREVVVARLDVVPAEHRAGDLRKRLRRDDQGLRRTALLSRCVRRIVIGGLGARMEFPVRLVTRRPAAWTAGHGRKPPASCTRRRRASWWDRAPDRSGSAWR